mgnify:CR=1 FL=1
MVDGKSGALPEDEAIARTLRRTEKPLSLLVNKVDVPHLHSDRLFDFHRLGFENMWGVSAEHGGGAFDALEDLVRSLPDPDAATDDAGDTSRIALIGRPNVGKSSLVNRLLGEERVVVSDQPGTTRDAIDVRLTREDQDFILVDTAGLRRPGRREAAGEEVAALMSVRALQKAQVALLLIDAEEGFTDQDAHIGRLARDMGVGTVAVPNKWDLVEGERMSGQDVRTNNGAASPPGLRSETKTRPENDLRGGFWRTAAPDRPIAASTAARARLQQHERGAGHVFSVRTPQARPNEPAPPSNAQR